MSKEKFISPENKHTPGEWFWAHRPVPKDLDGMYETQVFTLDGETVASLAWYPMPARQKVIEGKTMNVIGSYREANAKLIAAAPDLLKALQEMLSRFEGCEMGMIKADHVKERAKEAILKATI